MANKTIYGCYSEANNEVTFIGEACDSGNYTGCYIEDDGYGEEHKGQVAVAINETNCTDIYFTCFNATTGKFQLIIPDDCCEIILDTCENCENDTQPEKYFFTLSDFIDCGCISDVPCGHNTSKLYTGIADLLNSRQFELINQDEGHVQCQDGCEYYCEVEDSFGQWKYFTANAICSGGSTTFTYYKITMSLCLEIGRLNVNIRLHYDTEYGDKAHVIFHRRRNHAEGEDCRPTDNEFTNDRLCNCDSNVGSPVGDSGIVQLSW